MVTEENVKKRFAIFVFLLLGMVVIPTAVYGQVNAIKERKDADIETLKLQAAVQKQQISGYRLELDRVEWKLSQTQKDLVDAEPQIDEMTAKYSEMVPAGPPEVVTVDVIKEVPVYIEVEKEVSQEFREFRDLAELEQWLADNRLPITLVAGSDGSIDLNNPQVSEQYDCDDYAEDLQRKAMQQGFIMSQQLLIHGRIYGVKVTDIVEPHMGNLTTIGNDIYYIESIPPHGTVRITSRD